MIQYIKVYIIFFMFRKFIEKHLEEPIVNYESFLDDPSSKIWKNINQFLTTLVFIFMWALCFESLWDNGVLYKKELFYLDAFVSIIFALEYIYRFIQSKNKLEFPFSMMRIIDLLSFLPFFLWLVAAWDFLKVLRLLRILRVFRLVEKIPLTSGFIKSLKDYLDEYRAVFLLFFITLFIGSFFVYYFEQWVVGSKFDSIPISLWWWLVTMTTVWYGDMIPITAAGKIMWSFLIFLWPLLLALTSGVTIMVFTEAARHHSTVKSNMFRSKVCLKCKSKNRPEAKYCSSCGSKF